MGKTKWGNQNRYGNRRSTYESYCTVKAYVPYRTGPYDLTAVAACCCYDRDRSGFDLGFKFFIELFIRHYIMQKFQIISQDIDMLY